MIPKSVDASSLSGALRSADVAEQGSQDGPHLAPPARFHTAVDSAEHGARSDDFGKVKVAVLTHGDFTGADCRDIAQAIKNDTGANTVIVQTPGPAAVVSDHFSRFEIETHQHLLAGSVDPAATESFVQAMHGTHVPMGLIGSLILLGTAGAAGVAAVCARLFSRPPLKESSSQR